ncbi:hypothetical protein LXG21_00055, partial [Klebsiella pneumoniae]|nr:hypothetical protein [Klebsiella pneumoniae]MCF1635574.1 hypothetical protein [Klebsiella pneumoniae]
MGSCAAPSAKGDDKFITTDYLQQCHILFSALISPHGTPDRIYRAWRTARFEIVTSLVQLDEIRRASR